jgi:hypothetical protein
MKSSISCDVGLLSVETKVTFRAALLATCFMLVSCLAYYSTPKMGLFLWNVGWISMGYKFFIQDDKTSQNCSSIFWTGGQYGTSVYWKFCFRRSEWVRVWFWTLCYHINPLSRSRTCKYFSFLILFLFPGVVGGLCETLGLILRLIPTHLSHQWHLSSAEGLFPSQFIQYIRFGHEMLQWTHLPYWPQTILDAESSYICPDFLHLKRHMWFGTFVPKHALS